MHYNVCGQNAYGEGEPEPSGQLKGPDVFAGVLGGLGTGENAE